MDPISIVVAALAAGASTGLTDTVSDAIKDAYKALKEMLANRFSGIDISAVERMPASELKRESLEEDLKHLSGGQGIAPGDPILQAAERLVQAVEAMAPGAGAAVGVDLDNVKVQALRIRSVASSGTGVIVTRASFEGDIEIGDVRAGKGEASRDPQGAQ